MFFPHTFFMKMDSQKILHATLESMGKVTCEKKIVESAVSGGERTWEE